MTRVGHEGGWHVGNRRSLREYLGFEPDARREEVLPSGARRLLLNCSRQWGKSTVTALMAVHRAWFHPGSLVLGPCEGQAAGFVRKAREFVALLDVKARGTGRAGDRFCDV